MLLLSAQEGMQAIDGRHWSDRWPPVSMPLDAAIRVKLVRHADCIDLHRMESRAFKMADDSAVNCVH